MISKVEIGRLALSNVGARTSIESFTENSAEANAVNTWYDTCRKQTLEAFDWNFARKRQVLAPHGDAPPEGQWEFRYQYPSDCVMARRIENPVVPPPGLPISANPIFMSLTGAGQDAVPFTIEISTDGTMSILCNLDEAVLVYTFNLENTALFSLLFVEALARNIGSHIAFTLTGKLEVAEKQLGAFFTLVRIAQGTNANEGIPTAPRDAEWIRGR